jgi:guanosine-3',5'-bis(diphosphate) 3'-pyrophosphohydrolase
MERNIIKGAEKIDGLDLAKIFRAFSFASEKHKRQKRKNKLAYPFINHPIEAAHLLVEVGRIYDTDIICAAFLHDTLEDTDTTIRELEENFGKTVSRYVKELTDDTSLSSNKRKQIQADTFPLKSAGAKLIKLCDKLSNINDVIYDPPVFWTRKKRLEYLDLG